jgi:uncharacterized membrane protein
MGGMIMMLLVAAAVVVGAVWLTRRTVNNNTDTDALDVLRKRYALGELNKEQFEEMQETLRN